MLKMVRHTHMFKGPFSGTTQVSRYQKGKTNLDFTEARDSEWLTGSGISWDICKQSAPHSRQITTTTPHLSIFTGRMLFLTVSKHHRSQNEQKGKYIGQQLGNCCWNWSDPVTCFLVSQSKRFQLQSIMHYEQTHNAIRHKLLLTVLPQHDAGSM